MTTSTMSPRTRGKRPADFTGIQVEKLNEQKAAEQQEAANKLAMVSQVEAERKNEPVDYTESGEPLTVPEEASAMPEAVLQATEANDPYRWIRVNDVIENMTFGREVHQLADPEKGLPAVMGSIRMFNFEPGTPYKVPRELAEHLNRLGYLSYIGKM